MVLKSKTSHIASKAAVQDNNRHGYFCVKTAVKRAKTSFSFQLKGRTFQQKGRTFKPKPYPFEPKPSTFQLKPYRLELSVRTNIPEVETNIPEVETLDLWVRANFGKSRN
jgi:hypothetical protein